MTSMNSTNPWAPAESSLQIYTEETWLQGNLLSNIAYGAQLTIFVMCANALAKQIQNGGGGGGARRPLLLLIYICVIFTLGTLFMSAQAKFTQMAFIEYRNFPGGPDAYEEVMYSAPVDEIANTCFIIGNWLMDGFLIWRFIVIYKECGAKMVALMAFLPCMMLLSSVALGIAVLVQTSASSPFQDVNVTLAYYVMSLALNVIVTVFIVCRLMLFRRRMRLALGAEHVTSYANVAAIFIESAVLYAVFAILFLVPFGIGNSLANVFLQTVSQVQTLSSLMIVYRIATGHGWSETTNMHAIMNADSAIHLRHLTTLQLTKDGTPRPESVVSKDSPTPAPGDQAQPVPAAQGEQNV